MMPSQAVVLYSKAHTPRKPQRGTEILAAVEARWNALIRKHLWYRPPHRSPSPMFVTPVAAEIMRMALMAPTNMVTSQLEQTALNATQVIGSSRNDYAMLKSYYSKAFVLFMSAWSGIGADVDGVLEDYAIVSSLRTGAITGAASQDGDGGHAQYQLAQAAWALVAAEVLGPARNSTSYSDRVRVHSLAPQTREITVLSSAIQDVVAASAAGLCAAYAEREMSDIADFAISRLDDDDTEVELTNSVVQAVILAARSIDGSVEGWPTVADFYHVAAELDTYRPRQTQDMLDYLAISLSTLVEFVQTPSLSAETRRVTPPYVLSFLDRRWNVRSPPKGKKKDPPPPFAEVLDTVLSRVLVEGIDGVSGDAGWGEEGGVYRGEETERSDAVDAMYHVRLLMAEDMTSRLDRVDSLQANTKQRTRLRQQIDALLQKALRHVTIDSPYGVMLQSALALPEDGGLAEWFKAKPAKMPLRDYLHRSAIDSRTVWTSAQNFGHWIWLTGTTLFPGVRRPISDESDVPYNATRLPPYEYLPHTARSGILTDADLRVYAARASIIVTAYTKSSNDVPRSRKKAVAAVVAVMTEDIRAGVKMLIGEGGKSALEPVLQWPASLNYRTLPSRTGVTLVEMAGLVYLTDGKHGRTKASSTLFHKLVTYSTRIANSNATLRERTATVAGARNRRAADTRTATEALARASTSDTRPFFGLTCLPGQPPSGEGDYESFSDAAFAVLYAPHALPSLWESAGVGPLDNGSVHAVGGIQEGGVAGAVAYMTVTSSAPSSYPILASTDSSRGDGRWVVTGIADVAIHLLYNPFSMSAFSETRPVPERNIAAMAAGVRREEKLAEHRAVVSAFWDQLLEPGTAEHAATATSLVSLSVTVSDTQARTKGAVRMVPASVMTSDTAYTAPPLRFAATPMTTSPVNFFVGSDVRTVGDLTAEDAATADALVIQGIPRPQGLTSSPPMSTEDMKRGSFAGMIDENYYYDEYGNRKYARNDPGIPSVYSTEDDLYDTDYLSDESEDSSYFSSGDGEEEWEVYEKEGEWEDYESQSPV